MTAEQIDRSKMAEQLFKAHKEALTRPEQRGRQVTGLFRPEFDGYLWTCKDGPHMLDVVPYIAGKGNNEFAEGEWAYVLRVWVHRNIGPQDQRLVCIARTYGQNCEVCNAIRVIRKREDFEDSMISEIRPIFHDIYNVLVYDTDKDFDRGVQVWAIADYFMEANLKEIAKDQSGEPIYYSLPDERGRTVLFTRKGTGKGKSSFIGHRLDIRLGADGKPYTIGDEYLKQAHCLEDIIYIPTEQEVADLYYAGLKAAAAHAGAGETVPRRPSPAAGGLRRPGPAGTGLPPADDAPPLTDKDAPPERARRPAPAAPAPAGPARPPAQPANVNQVPGPAAASSGECPFGGVFGQDADKLEGCGDCSLYSDCVRVGEGTETKTAPPATQAPPAPPATRPGPRPGPAGAGATRPSLRRPGAK